MKAVLNYFLVQAIVISSASAQKETKPVPLIYDSALTIELTSKPALKDKKTVLQWKCLGFRNDGFCIIERSTDERSFEVIGVIKAAGFEGSFDFTDESPIRQKTFYRVKIAGPGEKLLFSNIISAENTSNSFYKFYPNPVDRLLIVRTEFPGEVRIADVNNKPRLTQELHAGLQTVDVSMLEKGLYVLTITSNNSSAIIKEKLIKN